MLLPVLIRPSRPPTSVDLEASGPVTFTAHGQTIENKEITSISGNAVTCTGFNDCILRKCKVNHEEGRGVRVNNSLRFLLEDADVVHTNPPVSGPHTTLTTNEHLNVLVDGGSHDFIGTRVRVKSGSSGFYFVLSDNAVLTNIEGYDQRGPFSRGQLVQFNQSDNCILQDFSTINDRTKAWTEDNINIFKSANAIIRRGLLDGNNSPSGAGLMAEASSIVGSNALFEDIDCINQGNVGFANVNLLSGLGLHGATMRRCRLRGMVNTSWQDRAFPGSSNGNTTSGLHFYLKDDFTGGGTFIELCKYWYVPSENNDLPLNKVWKEGTATYSTDAVIDLAPENFTPRSPISLTFPWE